MYVQEIEGNEMIVTVMTKLFRITMKLFIYEIL